MKPYVSVFQDILSSLFERKSDNDTFTDSRPTKTLCDELLTSKGEVSGYRLARIIIERVENFSEEERYEFFKMLAEDFDVDDDQVLQAGNAYREDRSAANLAKLLLVTEPKRQELLRRLNQFPSATASLVKIRENLLVMARKDKAFSRVDLDFQQLFNTWFNRGFLVLRRIDWQTPANVLEKIIEYEAVHEIGDWEDLRRRLQPEDRRCYGFFHPSMPDDPLIFVEVALGNEIPHSIQSILSPTREIISQQSADTAVFYSISNCQKGLKGISFGNFLIKQVVQDLKTELPNFKRFITLSPLPKFLATAEKKASGDEHTPKWIGDAQRGGNNAEELKQRAAEYLYESKAADGFPVDPVARFHLNNGALIEDLHVGADVSQKGLKQSGGVMVNYLYDLKKIEQNHEAYAAQQEIVVSSKIKGLVGK